FDSSAYYLLKLKLTGDQNPDSLKRNVPDILDRISKQGRTKTIYLWLSILMAVLALIFSYLLLRENRRKK
ncbi:MAG TPA: hypothetical protein VGQ59_07450, partial [Cyclobacteriaceae bacterium]|nr:hypothetical protein [Cyclobacteriaceae bacterium]